MAGMCCGVNMSETESSTPTEPSSESARRRRRMEMHQFRFVAPPLENGNKRKIIDGISPERVTNNALQINDDNQSHELVGDAEDVEKEVPRKKDIIDSSSSSKAEFEVVTEMSKYGITSVCGRRRDMEDAVAVYPSFCKGGNDGSADLHFYGVYDGHGCSHVATKCKDRMHEIVKEEVEGCESSTSTWEEKMMRSFSKMDVEVTNWPNQSEEGRVPSSTCRCELQTPHCDAVGSTAVVAVVSADKIVVSNCGDSRAVLCRKGVAIPLSSDHKPDRPDELIRIEEAGGRVIYWDGARVLGVLAMSRAIGDNYLKPYVISEPEVTITGRTDEDECLILASDGLWDVVSNETACGVARMCLQSRKLPSPPMSPGNDMVVAAGSDSSDKGCSDASILLTKLALARHSTDNVSVVVVDLRKNIKS
ncbi:protein phosphatase [Lithospermum erythrorhizon]|uniref:protein-serine/threonine phosphatase n=1 Tax=Lithospermum erythrorhizon TaxID=34254 RepID=A0AAV3PN26_LITER